MAIQILSEQTIEEAHEMARQSHTWNRGRSKINGREFWVIPSRSQPLVAHYVTSYGCTCRGARRRGNCAHQESVRIVEQQQADIDREIAAAFVAMPMVRYETLVPAECQERGCTNDAPKGERYCESHWLSEAF